MWLPDIIFGTLHFVLWRVRSDAVAAAENSKILVQSQEKKNLFSSSMHHSSSVTERVQCNVLMCRLSSGLPSLMAKNIKKTKEGINWGWFQTLRQIDVTILCFFGQSTHLSFILCRWFFLVFNSFQTVQRLEKGFGMVPGFFSLQQWLKF